MVEDLVPYRRAREPACQRQALKRRKIMRRARNKKKRGRLLAEFGELVSPGVLVFCEAVENNSWHSPDCISRAETGGDGAPDRDVDAELI